MGAKKRDIFIIVLIFILFVVSSWLTRNYSDQLSRLSLLTGYFGIFIYIAVFIISVVIAPFESLPLIPIAVTLWGPLTAAVLSIIGWTAGALIAFGLARKYGQKLICRLINKCDLVEYDFGDNNLSIFWMIVLARIVLPVDVASYVIGSFTKIKLPLYFVATIVGIVPFAFIFTYGVKLPIAVQIIAGVILIILFILNYSRIKKLFTFNKRP